MSKGLGQIISVVDTAQAVPTGESKVTPFTLINKGTASVFYRRSAESTTALSGIASVLWAAGGAELLAGKLVILPGGTWEVACATGLTATLWVLPGEVGDTAEALSLAEGLGLTFANFDLDEAVAGIADLGTSATGALVRLAELDLTMIAQGTVDIGYDDDGTGTNAVVLRGPYKFGAGGGINKEFRADPRGAIAEAPATKHLTITFTTAGGGGGGRISTGA